MRQSQLFTKTRREAPKDEVSRNAELLIRAGYVHKELAGVYSLLPLGLRVLEKINSIIRREMAGLGASEAELSALQDPTSWQTTGRWSDEVVDVWFKTTLKNESVVGLGLTHEEAFTMIMKDFIQSYRDLPRAVYQIQTKFRNETRAKSGLLRGREFLMKDLYSFHATMADLDEFYERVATSYERIFKAVGLGDLTYRTFASGGVFSKFSHEFQTICEAGEDTIYLSSERGVAVNTEVCTDEVLAELRLIKDDLVPHKAIEVGNIFKLGSRFSEALGLSFVDEAGERQPVLMASYGLGPTRILGTIAEVLSDERGLVWPAAVAPFAVHLIGLGGKDEAVVAKAEELYQSLVGAGIEVLYDDREVSAGEKFADSDLLGLPLRLVVSERSLAGGGVETKRRRSSETEIIPVDRVVAYCHG